MATVGQAVASPLSHPTETANKFLSVSSVTTTQNEVLKLLEAESRQKWQVEHMSSNDLEELGDRKKAEGDFSYFMLHSRHFFFSDSSCGFVKEGDSANWRRRIYGAPSRRIWAWIAILRSSAEYFANSASHVVVHAVKRNEQST